jgi:hypothetical protein
MPRHEGGQVPVLVLGTFLNLMKYYDIDKDIFYRGDAR